MQAAAAATPRLTLYPGYRFQPTKEELVGHYLYNKINQLPIPFDGSFVKSSCDLYGLHDPWDIWNAYVHDKLQEEDLYFFTRLKARTGKASRIDRKVGSSGHGTWHGEDSGTEFQVQAIDKDRRCVWVTGCRKRFSYRNSQSEQNGLWIMHEYSCPDLKSDMVICVLRRNGTPSAVAANKKRKFSSAGFGCQERVASIEDHVQPAPKLLCVHYPDQEQNELVCISNNHQPSSMAEQDADYDLQNLPEGMDFDGFYEGMDFDGFYEEIDFDGFYEEMDRIRPYYSTAALGFYEEMDRIQRHYGSAALSIPDAETQDTGVIEIEDIESCEDVVTDEIEEQQSNVGQQLIAQAQDTGAAGLVIEIEDIESCEDAVIEIPDEEAEQQQSNIDQEVMTKAYDTGAGGLVIEIGETESCIDVVMEQCYTTAVHGIPNVEAEQQQQSDIGHEVTAQAQDTVASGLVIEIGQTGSYEDVVVESPWSRNFAESLLQAEAGSAFTWSPNDEIDKLINSIDMESPSLFDWTYEY